MGIKDFWKYFMRTFGQCVYKLPQDKNLDSLNMNIQIDNLMIDLNGIFHPVAQKIFKYGNYTTQPRLLSHSRTKPRIVNKFRQEEQVFKKICDEIEKLLCIVNPTKRLVLCIDGPAPLAKQCIAMGTPITLANNTIKNIEEIEIGDKVLGWSQKQRGFIPSKVINKICNNIVNTYTIQLWDNTFLTCTNDHRILVQINNQIKWIPVCHLTLDMLIVKSITYPPIPEYSDSYEDWWLISFTGEKIERLGYYSFERLLALCRLIGYICSRPQNKYIKLPIDELDKQSIYNDINIITGADPDTEYKLINNNLIIPNSITELLKKLLFPRNVFPLIPLFLLVINTPRPLINAFLSGFLSNCKYVLKKSNWDDIVITVNGTNPNILNKFIDQLKHICYSISIDIDRNNEDTNIDIYFDSTDIIDSSLYFCYNHQYQYNLSVTKSYKYISALINDERAKIIKKIYKKIDKYNLFNTKLKNIRNEMITIYKALYPRLYQYIIPSIDDIKNYMIKGKIYSNIYTNILELPLLIGFNTVRWMGVPIKEIVVNIPSLVYDLEVENTHSFLASGICVHNCQQRQRRFKSSHQRSEEERNMFDSNEITPGTVFMHHLSNYIDWFIRMKLTTCNKWSHLEVIFSNEKVPSEGEQKALEFVRKNGNQESYCFHGLDADLIMLSLGTLAPKFWILRDDLFDPDNKYFVINIGEARNHLVNKVLKWESDNKDIIYDEKKAVYDYLFMCFMVGNDFLPNIPSIEIISGGLEILTTLLQNVGREIGHITDIKKGSNDVIINKKALKVLFHLIGQEDKKLLEEKIVNMRKYFTDTLLLKYSQYNNNNQKIELDMTKYKEEYYKKKFGDTHTHTEISIHYLQGLQWVLTYYTKGVPNWKWMFPYHYAPFATEIEKAIPSFSDPIWQISTPTTPFQQLLCVLPPTSSKLIPYPLDTLLTDIHSPIKHFYPDEFEIDIEGKRREWEGIVLLPMVDFEKIREEYNKKIYNINPREKIRDTLGKTFVYCRDLDIRKEFKSFYGNIRICTVRVLNR